MDYSKIHDIEMESVHTWDYPDLCDAFISYATYDGIPMTDEQLEKINNDRDFVHQCATNSLY
jgi:hypothetical protein